MSKQQKIQSEMKHKKVYRFLVSQFPGCKVTYDGVQGIDCFVTHDNKTIPIEIKTCRRIVKNNIIRIPNHPILYSKYKLGRFKFSGYQQEQLLAGNGWYVFMIDNSITFGVKAKDLQIKNISAHWISWVDVIQKSYPDWLERLKKEVYCQSYSFDSMLEELWNNEYDERWNLL